MIIEYKHPLFINLIQHCNFRCSYCYTESSPDSDHESYITRNWHEILEQIVTLKVPEIRLAGGEPLLYKRIKTICSTIQESGIKYSITTNGKLINKHLRWLSKAQPSTLWLSYHKEYMTLSEYSKILNCCGTEIKNIGVNIFAEDLISNSELRETIFNSPIRRIKVLYKTKLGRYTPELIDNSYNSIDSVSVFLHQLSSRKIEVRVEAPAYPNSLKGKETCPLANRPLITINFDGTVTECCVLSNNTLNPFGSLNNETLPDLIDRYLKRQYLRLPCHNVLDGIEEGREACPLHLINI